MAEYPVLGQGASFKLSGWVRVSKEGDRLRAWAWESKLGNCSRWCMALLVRVGVGPQYVWEGKLGPHEEQAALEVGFFSTVGSIKILRGSKTLRSLSL